MSLPSPHTAEPDAWHRLVFPKSPDTSPNRIWNSILSALARALASGCPDFDRLCQPLDELLAKAAWDLAQAWCEDPDCEDLRSTHSLANFWDAAAPSGRAVLILDALSLREAALILAEARKRNVPLNSSAVRAVAAPTTTDNFATSLGIPGRASLKQGSLPVDSVLEGAQVRLFEGVPFDACLHDIPHSSHLLVWHDLVDSCLHTAKSQADLQIRIAERISHDGFWDFIDRLRQGRSLLITSDHGYAARRMASHIPAPAGQHVAALMHASRVVPIQDVAPPMIPPLVVQVEQQYALIGNRSWTVKGGFPEFSHGGLSILELAVPLLEFAPRR